MSDISKDGFTTIDLLALGAHPDDIEIHAGGAIAQLTALGKSVIFIDATRGECSSNGTMELREVESRAAAGLLGVQQRLNLKFSDTRLNRETHELTDSLVQLLRHWRPAVVLAPPLDARHPDHRTLAQCTKDAIFLSGLCKIMPTLPAMLPRARLIHYHEHESARPDFLIDVSPTWKLKLQALQCYASQFVAHENCVATGLNNGFLERLEHHARTWGATIGVTHAECFTSDRPVMLGGLLG